MKTVYIQVRDEVHTKLYRLRGQLRKQISKQPILPYPSWVQIRDQVQEQLKQNISL